MEQSMFIALVWRKAFNYSGNFNNTREIRKTSYQRITINLLQGYQTSIADVTKQTFMLFEVTLDILDKMSTILKNDQKMFEVSLSDKKIH